MTLVAPRDLHDPRRRGKVVYPLDEIPLVCLLAVLAGAEACTDITLFGDKKLDPLRRFRPVCDGGPSHVHLGAILASLDAERLQRCFVAWRASLPGASAEVIAIDGEASRRAYQKKGGKAPIYMVSNDIDRLDDAHRWPGLKSVVVIDSRREIERETRLYITLLVLAAHQIGPIVRSHRAIDSSLDGIMDMVFRDDECSVSTEHAPASFAPLEHIPLDLTREAP